jgi:hypothetical protein
MNRFGPCMCGATDCRSCGPAQGYRLDDEDAEYGDDRDEDLERDMAALCADDADCIIAIEAAQ